jgi:hypothetical protein
MYKLFENKSIVAYLIVAFLVILLGFKVFVTGPLGTESEGSFLFTHVLKTHLWGPSLLRSLVFVVLLIGFFMFNLIFKEFSYQSKSGLFAIFVVCIHNILALSLPFNLEGVFSILLFLILSLLVLKLEKIKDTTSSFFNLGFVFVLSTVATNYMLFFLFPLIFAMFIYGRNGLRDFLAMIVGISTPIIILGSIILLQNNQEILGHLVFGFKQIKYLLLSRWEWLILGLTAVSFIVTLPIINSFTIATRKFYTYLFFCILVLIPAFILIGISGNKPYGLTMTLASFYILPFILKTYSRLFKNLMLFLGIVAAIFATFVQFK